MQEIVDENKTIEVSPAAQFAPNPAAGEQKAYRIQFHQIYLSKPIVNENDGETSVLFPREARLRNLTYVENKATREPTTKAKGCVPYVY